MAKVVLVRAKQYATIEDMDLSLDNMQNFVGGYIEGFYPFDDEVAIICNDEGKLNGSTPNRAICYHGEDNGAFRDGELIDIVFGDFIIADCKGENFGSLTDEMAKKYCEMFYKPEKMIRKDNEIVSVKYDL